MLFVQVRESAWVSVVMRMDPENGEDRRLSQGSGGLYTSPSVVFFFGNALLEQTDEGGRKEGRHLTCES
jgi:hypothetical protein